jgi:hypothetical protein
MQNKMATAAHKVKFKLARGFGTVRHARGEA